MNERIRLVVDEHIDLAVVAGLRRRGADIVTFHEVGRRGETDADQMAWALSAGRVVVTHDNDFLALARRGVPHAGIAFCSAAKYPVGGLIRAVVGLWEARDANEMADNVYFL